MNTAIPFIKKQGYNNKPKYNGYLTSGSYLGNPCCKCLPISCCSLQIRKPPPLPEVYK